MNKEEFTKFYKKSEEFSGFQCLKLFKRPNSSIESACQLNQGHEGRHIYQSDLGFSLVRGKFVKKRPEKWTFFGESHKRYIKIFGNLYYRIN